MTEAIAFPAPDYDDLGQVVAANLRAAIAIRQVPQEVIAARLGLSQQAVSDRLRGRVRMTVSDMGRLADLLGLEPGELLVRHQGLEPRTRWFGAYLRWRAARRASRAGDLIDLAAVRAGVA